MPNDNNNKQFDHKIVARKLYKQYLEKKFKLPASFDDCSAYFTGYRKSTVQTDSAAAFLNLGRKCIDYCEAVNDKEGMRLLMYAILKRTNPSAGYVRLGIEYDLMILIDLVLGDSSGIYEHLKDEQTHDLAKLFHALLNCFEETKLNLVNFKVITSSQKKYSGVKNIALWKEKFSDTGSKNSLYSFTRGGGLYNFLDLIKGISAGNYDDSKSVRGIYVTPEEQENRDEIYAYGSNRCRRFFDKPCQQKGKIDEKHLLSTNNNDYEAFIATHNISAIQDLRISLFSESYKNREKDILLKSALSKIIEKYLPTDDNKFLERLTIVHEVIDQPREEREQKLTTLLEKYHEEALLQYPSNCFH